MKKYKIYAEQAFIKKILIDFCETQTDLARKLNCSRAYVSCVLSSDKIIPFSLIEKIIEFYKINKQDIYNAYILGYNQRLAEQLDEADYIAGLIKTLDNLKAEK